MEVTICFSFRQFVVIRQRDAGLHWLVIAEVEVVLFDNRPSIWFTDANSGPVTEHLSEPRQLRISEWVLEQAGIPTTFIAQIKPAYLGYGIVRCGFRFGFVTRTGLARNWMADVGLSPLVRAIRVRRLIKYKTVYLDLEIGFFLHFADNAFLFRFGAFYPTSRDNPIGTPCGVLLVPDQEYLMALDDCTLISCMPCQFSLLTTGCG
jgi:hypothetical protein